MKKIKISNEGMCCVQFRLPRGKKKKMKLYDNLFFSFEKQIQDHPVKVTIEQHPCDLQENTCLSDK